MGITYVDGQAVGAGKRRVAVRFLVDSGAAYTLLPQAAWKALKLKPLRNQTFALADGTTIERAVSECKIVVPQGEATSPVILGEAGDEPLLGVVTLEILGLVLNPFNRTLQPMRAMLAGIIGRPRERSSTRGTAPPTRRQRRPPRALSSAGCP